jgi:hypothetical protein
VRAGTGDPLVATTRDWCLCVDFRAHNTERESYKRDYFVLLMYAHSIIQTRKK